MRGMIGMRDEKFFFAIMGGNGGEAKVRGRMDELYI